MKILKKVLLGLAVLILLVLLAGGLFVRQVARKALPDYNQSLYLEGLGEEVEVYRDAHAIPHIYASKEYDLYLATGYVMAQERLWQMDLLRRVTMGRLSEIFGEDLLGADQLLRALRIPEKSARVLETTPPEILQALEAFSLGVNQYIERNSKKLPPEFTILGYRPEPWQPIHSANLIGYMAWDLSGSWNTEVILHKLKQVLEEEKYLQLIPDMDLYPTPVYPSPYEKHFDYPNELVSPTLAKDDPAEFAPQEMFSLLDHADDLRALGLEVFSASNTWVVSGERSETGAPLLANDMHLSFGAPGIWMQMHQVAEGRVNVAGLALPGQPFVIVGHNEKIAWGMTNLYVDDIDFYLETTDASHPDRYLFEGEWKDMLVSTERIAIKGGDTIERINRFTHRGPVVSGFKNVSGQEISMRWSGNEYSNELRSIYLLNRASDWASFRDALTTFTSISQNITFADIYGNIGQQAAGGVPVRRQGRGIFVNPGYTSQYDWDGMLPFEALPYAYNPDEGQVSSANNRTVGDVYPYYIGHWFDTSHRIDRIREMLNEKEMLGLEDFKRMQTDAKSKLAENVIDDLNATLASGSDYSENEQKAIAHLSSWDAVMAKESRAATIFENFFSVFMRNVLLDEMGEELYRQFNSGLIRTMFDYIWQNPTSSWVNNTTTSHEETFDEVVVQSFREAVQILEDQLGKDTEKWAWGEVHQLTVSHQMGGVKLLDFIFGLNKGPYPVGGSFHTVTNYRYNFHNPFGVVHGPSHRHVYNLADWADNHVIIPTGTSGIPASKYYLDQTEPFVKGEYNQMAWTKENVVAGARYKAILAPRQ